MEGDKANSVPLPEMVEAFKHLVNEIFGAMKKDENFNEMTAESYEKKKSYIKSHLLKFSLIHNYSAIQYAYLINEVSKHCPSLLQNLKLESSDSTSPPQVTNTLAPRFSAATGVDVLLRPGGGGFILSKRKGPSPVIDNTLKVEETKDPGSESSLSSDDNPPILPPVNDEALKAEETEDSGSESSMASVNKPPVLPAVNDDDALKVEETKDSGSESSMSSVNKPPAVIDDDDGDALKVDESKDPEALVEKTSNLEEEVSTLKQKLQSLTVENDELNQEVEDNVRDVSVYMSKSKLEIEAMEDELKALKEMAMKSDQHMFAVLVEKMTNQSKHESEIKEMNMKMDKYMTEISELKATHEKKEKIFKGLIEHLKQEVEKKGEKVNELSKNMSILWDDKRSQDILIHQLKADLKCANVGVLPSFDNVQKLTDELKLKVVELETVVDRQREAISNTK